MSTQQGPPSRPWFRLATMIRPSPPPATTTSQGPPPPRPAFIRPAFAPTATQSTPNPPPPQPTPIPPLPQANPTSSPPVPASNVVAPTASDLPPVTKASSPKPPQSSAPNTPPSQKSASPFAIVGSPPQAPHSQSIKPSPATTTSPITATRAVTPPTFPSKIVQQLEEQISPPILPSVNAITTPATSPRIQKISFSAPSPKPPQSAAPTTIPPSLQSTPPLEIFSSPTPAPQSQSIAVAPSLSPITTTRTFTPPKVSIKPLEQIPAVNVATPPGSPRIQKFPFSAPPSPPNSTRLIPSPPSSPPRPPPVQQSEYPLPVSGSPQSSPPHIVKLPEKTSPNVNPLSPLVLPSLKHKSYNEKHPEYKQKIMHVRETKENPKDSVNGYNDMHIVAWNTHSSKHDIPRKPETYMKHRDSGVVTIAGENKGAIMRLTPSGDKTLEFGNNRQRPISSSHGETLETASEAKINKHQNSSNPLLKTSFLNCNVQGVNNSILYSCSINHHDPGIHLTLSRKSDGDCGFHPKEHKKG